MVYLYYISCLRYTILARNPRVVGPFVRWILQSNGQKTHLVWLFGYHYEF